MFTPTADLMRNVMDNLGEMHEDTKATGEHSMFQFASAIHMYLNRRQFDGEDNQFSEDITEAMQNLEK